MLTTVDVELIVHPELFQYESYISRSLTWDTDGATQSEKTPHNIALVHHNLTVEVPLSKIRVAK